MDLSIKLDTMQTVSFLLFTKTNKKNRLIYNFPTSNEKWKVLFLQQSNMLF